MVVPRFAKLFAVAVSAAFVCSMAGMPAYALTDTNLDETTGASTGTSATPASADESPSLQSQPSADQAESMPDNPTKDLPQTVSEAVPDDATVVSEELAVTDAGEVMDLETGDTVCILMLLYIVKGFGVLGWLVRGGDGLDPEGGASFEFG